MFSSNAGLLIYAIVSPLGQQSNQLTYCDGTKNRASNSSQSELQQTFNWATMGVAKVKHEEPTDR